MNREIFRYNLVNEKTKTIPNYDLGQKQVYIKIYVDMEDNLIILGYLDNNYICWASLTKTEETDTNAAIIQYIMEGKHETVSSSYGFYFDIINRNVSDLIEWYCVTIEKNGHQYWFDKYSLEGTNAEISGENADNIRNLKTKLQKLCKESERDGSYLEKLKKYDEKIKRVNKGNGVFCVSAYDTERIWEMEQELKKESWHLLSENAEIRQMYRHLVKECHSAYCAYRSFTY